MKNLCKLCATPANVVQDILASKNAIVGYVEMDTLSGLNKNTNKNAMKVNYNV